MYHIIYVRESFKSAGTVLADSRCHSERSEESLKLRSFVGAQTICNDLQFVDSWIYPYTTDWKNQMVTGLPHTKGGHQTNYSTVYVGMDVHKDSFSLCCYTNEKEKAEYIQKVEGHYSKVIKSEV